MKRVIWKFPIAAKQCEIAIPVGARCLRTEFDPKGQLCMWLLVDPEAKKRNVTVRAVATGEEFDDAGLTYIATIQQTEFVWHLFQVTEQVLVPISDPTSN